VEVKSPADQWHQFCATASMDRQPARFARFLDMMLHRLEFIAFAQAA
jgi:hypothetical protein